MLRDLWDMSRTLWDHVKHHPYLTGVGTMVGLLFPVEPLAIWALSGLIAVDTITGYQAAIMRGEEVRSGIMFKKAAKKLRGYALFVITMGLASLVTGKPAIVQGAFSFLGAIEAFSVTENFYDLELIDINPNRVVFFKPVIEAVRQRKARRNENTHTEQE